MVLSLVLSWVVFLAILAAAVYYVRKIKARLAEWQNLAEIACDDADELEEECERLKARLAFGHAVMKVARQMMTAAAVRIQEQREYIDALDIHVANLELQLYGERTESEGDPFLNRDGYGIDPAGEPDFTAYAMAESDNHKVVG
jgi:enoyl-CoA hydratase/carnithine racemase